MKDTPENRDALDRARALATTPAAEKDLRTALAKDFHAALLVSPALTCAFDGELSRDRPGASALQIAEGTTLGIALMAVSHADALLATLERFPFGHPSTSPVIAPETSHG